MAKLTILGSAAAVPDMDHENAYMVLEGEKSAFLIDCAGSPLARLRAAGVDPDKLGSLIITHHHPDHIYGVPSLLLGLRMYGRRAPFDIFGTQQSLAVIWGIMDLLGWQKWPGPFPVGRHEVKMAEEALVVDSDEFEVRATPTEHSLSSIGLRIVSKATGGVVAYSSDTEPCDAFVRLAQGADILIHESTGDYAGHSTGAQAGAVAGRCGARKLVLIHYPIDADFEALRREAEKEFGGLVELAEDFATWVF
ncbi:MAG TPA: MBL fold metallo-hydrolase [Anaerolineae bacterium]|nr:MBL fold metallo-hydrolase [Anaerolineae bacterium]